MVSTESDPVHVKIMIGFCSNQCNRCGFYPVIGGLVLGSLGRVSIPLVMFVSCNVDMNFRNDESFRLVSEYKLYVFSIIIPRHTIMAGYKGFTLDVRVSVRPSVRFSFPDDNLSKHQWIFTKLGTCIDIVEI